MAGIMPILGAVMGQQSQNKAQNSAEMQKNKDNLGSSGFAPVTAGQSGANFTQPQTSPAETQPLSYEGKTDVSGTAPSAAPVQKSEAGGASKGGGMGAMDIMGMIGGMSGKGGSQAPQMKLQMPQGAPRPMQQVSFDPSQGSSSNLLTYLNNLGTIEKKRR